LVSSWSPHQANMRNIADISWPGIIYGDMSLKVLQLRQRFDHF
jgi:hypothetical protein